MNKKVRKILIIISIIIIILGIVFGIGISHELMNSVANVDEKAFMIDGSDFSAFAKLFFDFGSIIIGIVIVISTLAIILAIWAIYLIILLVIKIINKIKEKKNENH